jgi:ABC-type transport system substrate-binding protein
VESYGVRHWWNLYCTYKALDQQGKLGNPSVGGQLRWGFTSDVQALNPLYSQQMRDWQILDKVFDQLIRFNPLNGGDTPWMVSGWSFGTWMNPETSDMASKITVTLRTDLKWANSTNGVILGTVTPQDVKFSFQYVHDVIGWNYPLVSDIYVNPGGDLKIEISGNQITFYESIQSCWALHWIGSLPIIPKFLYETIPDPHGFTPGNLGIEQTMIGSGPFYYASYTSGVSALLKANRNYFMPIVPNWDTDPTITSDWGIFKANVKSGDWTVNVLDLIVVANSLGWTGPPGGIPADINKDGSVNVLDLIIVATMLGASW